MRFEQLLSDLAARSVSISPGEIDREIERVLQAIVDFFHVSQCLLTKGSPEEKRAVITHAAKRTEGTPTAGGINVVSLFPWTSEMLLRGEVVRVRALEELPAEAAADREAYARMGVRSILTIPLFFEGSMSYSISIASREEERDWPQEYVPRLQLVGEILVNAIERRRSRAELEERLQFETLLADLSARFVASATDQLDSPIEDAQRRVCELLSLDRSTLWQTSHEDPGVPMRMTYSYQASEPPLPKGLLAINLFPWTLQKILKGESVIVSSMDLLPPEAVRDRDSWRQLGTKSTVVLPLSAGGGTILGALTFAQVTEERAWPQTVTKYLQLIAQVFANALFRKKADDALRKSEERLLLAADAAEIGMWSVDFATNHLWNSEGSFVLLGLDRDVNLDEKLFFSLVHPEDRERLRQIMTEAVVSKTDARAEFRIVRPDGIVRWLITRARTYYGPSGKPNRLAGVSLDITDRKSMEEKIQASAEEWQRTFDSVQDQIMILDKDLRIIRINASARSFLGLPLEDILGKHCFSLMHGTSEPPESCPLARMMETKKSQGKRAVRRKE